MVDYCRFWLDCKTAKPEDLRRAGKIAQEALSQHHADMDARAEAYLGRLVCLGDRSVVEGRVGSADRAVKGAD